MINMARRIIKQIMRDKRSVGMMVVVPLFLLTLFYLLLSKSGYIPTVMTDGLTEPFLSALKESKAIKVVETNYSKPASEILKDGEADALITFDANGIRMLLLEPDAVKMSAISGAVQKTAAKLNPKGQTSVDFVYGNGDESVFDRLGFLLLGILSFFLIFLFSGISFVRERACDTVERLMLTPVKTSSVIGGYVLGFGVFAIVQSALLIIYAKLVLKIPFAGEWWLAMLVMLMLAVMAVTMGVLVSAISKNEFQVMQFIPTVIIPQIFFSGLIPVDTLPYNLNYVSMIMPLYYGCEALKGILVYGYGFTQILPQILTLLGIIAVLFALNIAAVKRYRAV